MHVKTALCSLSYLLDHPCVPFADLRISQSLRELSKALLVLGICWVRAIIRFEVNHLFKRCDLLLDGLEGQGHDLDFMVLVHVLLVLDRLSLGMELMILHVVGKVSEVFIVHLSIVAQP